MIEFGLQSDIVIENLVIQLWYLLYYLSW